ncbi:hypothetical protein PoB_005681800 [Plakobranchus ocellatus]|uniref:Uncharacterized protein n=1 Tax=Plakobranchus ocellatus TaxID=259542 RepID=A0AAV4CGY9_9GAST|nr:hypothetical protein PoB_005681800 [Plakobranchus ocellatus]
MEVGRAHCQRKRMKVRKKRQGRLKANWTDEIRKASGPEWQGKVQDRRKWKTVTEGYILERMDIASKCSTDKHIVSHREVKATNSDKSATAFQGAHHCVREKGLKSQSA